MYKAKYEIDWNFDKDINHFLMLLFHKSLCRSMDQFRGILINISFQFVQIFDLIKKIYNHFVGLESLNGLTRPMTIAY